MFCLIDKFLMYLSFIFKYTFLAHFFQYAWLILNNFQKMKLLRELQD